MTWPTTWRTPEWEADYRATLKSNPELAHAMLMTHHHSDTAGQVWAGEQAMEGEGAVGPDGLPRMY